MIPAVNLRRLALVREYVAPLPPIDTSAMDELWLRRFARHMAADMWLQFIVTQEMVHRDPRGEHRDAAWMATYTRSFEILSHEGLILRLLITADPVAAAVDWLYAIECGDMWGEHAWELCERFGVDPEWLERVALHILRGAS